MSPRGSGPRRTGVLVLLSCTAVCSGWSGVVPSLTHHRLRLRAPVLSEYGPMSYRELQQACKARGLPAKGKAEELRARLSGEEDTGAEMSTQMPLTPLPPVDESPLDESPPVDADDPEGEALFAEFESETEATAEEIDELESMDLIDIEQLELLEQEETKQEAAFGESAADESAADESAAEESAAEGGAEGGADELDRAISDMGAPAAFAPSGSLSPLDESLPTDAFGGILPREHIYLEIDPFLPYVGPRVCHISGFDSPPKRLSIRLERCVLDRQPLRSGAA